MIRALGIGSALLLCGCQAPAPAAAPVQHETTIERTIVTRSPEWSTPPSAEQMPMIETFDRTKPDQAALVTAPNAKPADIRHLTELDIDVRRALLPWRAKKHSPAPTPAQVDAAMTALGTLKAFLAAKRP